MTALEGRNISVRYPGTPKGSRPAVSNVSLHVPMAGAVGLVGESGSGKSTIARALVGLLPLDKGEVFVEGRPLRGIDRRVQMVFQDPFSSLNPRMSVGESIAEAIQRRHGQRAARVRRTRDLLDLVSLDPSLVEVLPSQLSGGQRQRVAIARALAAEPLVLIADEITSSLDVSAQALILNLLRRLREQLGLSLLLVSHNLAVVRYCTDSVSVMYRGGIIESGGKR